MVRRVVVLGLLACLVMVGSASAFLAGYGYYQDAMVNNGGASNLTNYQVMFVVNTSSGTSTGTTIYLNSHSEADLDDLRFTATDDTVYDYWIESTSSPYNVWVEVPALVTGNTTVRVQYGNAAASAYSNGTNTFIFFDDFEDGSLHAQWSTQGLASCTETGGYVQPIGNTSTWSGSVPPPSTIAGIYNAGLNLDAGFQLLASITYDMDTNDMMGEGELTLYAGTTGKIWSGPQDQHSASKGRWQAGVAGGSTYDSGTGTRTTGTALITMERNESDVVTCKEDATSRATGTMGNTITRLILPNTRYTTHLAIITKWNYIRIRNLVDTEPTVPAWSGESATTAAPVAAFSANRTTGAPGDVAFTDSSTNTPTSWAWSFDDGSPNSTSQNPTRTFAAGTYTIILTATNDVGSDTEEKIDYITLTNPPVAAFSANVTSGIAPLNVGFTDASTNTPTSWAWSFDDGNPNSTSQNPTRTFAAGTYTIILTATNAGGSDTETKVDYITAATLTAFPGCSNPPTDVDADGLYEDINGNGRKDWSDLILFFTHLAWAKATEPNAYFDFANDGGTITYADTRPLYQEVSTAV